MRLHALPTLNECIQQIDLDFKSESGFRSHTVWVSGPDFPRTPACPTGLAAFPSPGVHLPACDRVVHVNAAFDIELSRWLVCALGCSPGC